MRKTLLHILLSFALIFQGTGAACASGMKMGDMDSTAPSASSMAMGADTASDGCEECPSCPDQQKHQHGSDCAPGCTVTSAVLPLRMLVPQVQPASNVVLTPHSSLVGYLRPPPTRPPIA